MLPFPTSEHDEGRVRAFALHIEEVVADEDTFLENQDARSTHLENELKRVKAETVSALQSVREERRQLAEKHQTHPLTALTWSGQDGLRILALSAARSRRSVLSVPNAAGSARGRMSGARRCVAPEGRAGRLTPRPTRFRPAGVVGTRAGR
ncbi:hypothetical protein [Streptomyces mayteni]